MKLEVEIPDSLFQTSTIIDGIDESGTTVKFTGQAVSNDKINTSEWSSHGALGFVTSDLKSETTWNKIQHLALILNMARQNRTPLMFLFKVIDSISPGVNTLWIFAKEKKSW